MNIRDKIEAQWLSYVGETGRMPKYLYLGYSDRDMLDKELGMMVFVHRGMEVVGVEKEHHVSVGNKYNEVV